jgi:hypothetical protein
MPVPVFNDPKLCQCRADEARALAAETRDEELRELMEELAEEYDALAREIEARRDPPG